MSDRNDKQRCESSFPDFAKCRSTSLSTGLFVNANFSASLKYSRN